MTPQNLPRGLLRLFQHVEKCANPLGLEDEAPPIPVRLDAVVHAGPVRSCSTFSASSRL